MKVIRENLSLTGAHGCVTTKERRECETHECAHTYYIVPDTLSPCRLCASGDARSTSMRSARDTHRPRPPRGGEMEVDDAERGILGAKATSAICVQSFDDSLNSAIHITYRISLRSSSLREPRYPLLRVLDRFKGRR